MGLYKKCAIAISHLSAPCTHSLWGTSSLVNPDYRRHSHADTPKTVLISIKAKSPLDLEFPKLALDELEKMSSWIFHHLSDKKSFTDVYCQVREECMRQTIHGMREHVRQESGITPRKNFTIRRSIASRKSEKRKSIRNRTSVIRMTRFQSSRSFMSPDKGTGTSDHMILHGSYFHIHQDPQFGVILNFPTTEFSNFPLLARRAIISY